MDNLEDKFQHRGLLSETWKRVNEREELTEKRAMSRIRDLSMGEHDKQNILVPRYLET